MSNWPRMRTPGESDAVPRSGRGDGVRRAAARVLLACLVAVAAACGDKPAPEAPATLPGIAPDQRDWSWRDVLAASLPGEPPAVKDALELPRPVDRVDALDALASARDARAVPTAMAALRDETVGVAAAAAHWLGELDAAQAIPRLLNGLGPYPVDYDVPIAVRVAEASALARLHNPAGVPLLLAVLAEGTSLQLDNAVLPWTRSEQNAFMQELALPGLRALAGSDFGFHPMASVPAREQSVRQATDWWTQQRLALWSAAPIDDPGLQARARLLVAHLGAYQLRQIDAARHVLANLGPGAITFLQDGLASPDDYVRVHCLEVLERMVETCDGKQRARIATLASTPLLEDQVATVAAQAARTVGATGVADALIVALARRTEPEVVVAIVDGLARAKRPEGLAAIEDLAAALEAQPPPAGVPGDVAVSIEAARLALDCQRPPDTFLSLLASDDRELSFAALERLITLTGSNCGFDPAAPPDARATALITARAALAERCKPKS
jgi:hypothetical protein